jgi:hypothetical protein
VLEHRGRGLDGIDLIALTLEQQTEGLEHVALIVGDEKSCGRCGHGLFGSQRHDGIDPGRTR